MTIHLSIVQTVDLDILLSNLCLMIENELQWRILQCVNLVILSM